MDKYAVINLKTDPELKKKAAKTAKKLGVSLSAVLNNELRRFTAEQSVSFERPEVPNAATRKRLEEFRREVERGDYLRFESNEEALRYLEDELR